MKIITKSNYGNIENVDYGSEPFILIPVFSEQRDENGRYPLIGYVKEYP